MINMVKINPVNHKHINVVSMCKFNAAVTIKLKAPLCLSAALQSC